MSRDVTTAAGPVEEVDATVGLKRRRFDRGFLVADGIALLTLAINIASGDAPSSSSPICRSHAYS